jgi:hypothetical protein
MRSGTSSLRAIIGAGLLHQRKAFQRRSRAHPDHVVSGLDEDPTSIQRAVRS